MPIFVKAHMRRGSKVKGYSRSSLAQANRYLGLSKRLTQSVMKRGVMNFSRKRLVQLDATIQSLDAKGYEHVNTVLKKKANLQSMMKKSKYGLGYKSPQ